MQYVVACCGLVLTIFCLPSHLHLCGCPVPQPDPNTPKPEGRQIIPVKGEPLGVVSNWPPALQAALARWGATQAKSPALTALDITGKPLYTLTYGEQHLRAEQRQRTQQTANMLCSAR